MRAINTEFTKAVQKCITSWKGAKEAFTGALFSLDMYSFQPSVATVKFQTLVSLLVSLLVASSFMFCVGFTTYLWAASDYSVSQGELNHDNSTVLLPASFTSGNPSFLPFPDAGVMLLLGNNTSPVDTSLFRVVWSQQTICSGRARGKFTDTLATTPCSFFSPEDGQLRTNTTVCPDWPASVALLGSKNNTANDPCQISSTPTYTVPRISGTFYDTEFSYVTASSAINTSAFLTDPQLSAQVYGGSVQLYLQYPYTSTTSLVKGDWPDGENVVWSQRVNLLQNTTVKWELTLRVRQVTAASFFWDIPQLENNALDFQVQSSSVSLAQAVIGADGYQEVAKIYLKFDDRDAQISMSPYTNVFYLISDWGGFLSILVAIGIPALIYNEHIFRSTVEKLVKSERITFNEDLRKHRSEAVIKAYSMGMKGVSMHRKEDNSPVSKEKPKYAAARRRSLLSETSYGATTHITSAAAPSDDILAAIDQSAAQPHTAVGTTRGAVQQAGFLSRALRTGSAPLAQTWNRSSRGPSLGLSSLDLEAPPPPWASIPTTAHSLGLAEVFVSVAEESNSMAGARPLGEATESNPPPSPFAAQAEQSSCDQSRAVGSASGSGQPEGEQRGIAPSQNEPAAPERDTSLLPTQSTDEITRRQGTATPSIYVNYKQDIFEDSDENENDFDDVVRHCTSECHALFHLRQVVMLVKAEHSHPGEHTRMK